MDYVPLEHWKAKEKETDTEKAPQRQPNVSPKSSDVSGSRHCSCHTHNTHTLPKHMDKVEELKISPSDTCTWTRLWVGLTLMLTMMMIYTYIHRNIRLVLGSMKSCGTCKRNWNTSTWTRLCPVCDGLPLATMMMTVYEYACAENDDDDLSNGEMILDREDGKG